MNPAPQHEAAPRSNPQGRLPSVPKQSSPKFDFALADARRCGAPKETLALFDDDELRGLVWAAQMPDVFRCHPEQSRDILFDQSNWLAGSFWNAYLRHPDTALDIVRRVRDRAWTERHELAMKQVLREQPDISNLELADRVAKLTDGITVSQDTAKKRRQRLAAAGKSGLKSKGTK